MRAKKRIIALNTILLLIAGFCLKSYTFAQASVSTEDKIIGSTFKTLAKAYVAIVDINKLKQGNICKLNSMDEEKFQRRYVKIYEVIKDLPPALKARYKISEQMTKQEAIQNIQSLDKKKIYEMIDLIPDTLIAKHFKQYLKNKKQQIQKSDIVEQIKNSWNKIIEKAEGK